MCNERVIRTENQHFVSKKFSNFPSSLNCGNSAFPGNKYAIFNIFIIQFVTGCLMRVSTISFKQNPTTNTSPHVTWNICPARVPSISGESWSAFDSYSPKILCPTSHTGHEIGWKPSSQEPALSKSFASPHWRLQTLSDGDKCCTPGISLTQWFMCHFP